MFKKRVLAVFVILQVVVASMFPASAYAATYAPVVDRDWNSTSYCVSGVSNRFDAALGLIGQWGKKIQISNDMYVKLSNESSGGAFWTLADSMVNPVVGANRMATAPEGWGLGPISTVLWLKIVGTCWAEYGSPADWMWCTSVNQELIDNANSDFLKVLNGESLGPSGGGGSNSNVLSTSFVNRNINEGFKWGDTRYSVAPPYAKYNPNDCTLLPANLAISYDEQLFEDVPDVAKNYDRIFVLTYPSNFNFAFVTFTCYLAPSGSYSWANNPFTFDNVSYNYFGYLSINAPYYRLYGITAANGGVTQYTSLRLDASNCSFTGSSFQLDIGTGSRFRWNYVASGSSSVQSGLGMVSGAGGGGSGGDNHWPEPTTPDPDPNPTNPEPDPEPPTPPEFDPPGFDPDVPQPDPTPTPVGEPSNTTAADYTPWLRAILTALNVIIDDMGEHCDHIRVAMRDYLNGLYEALSDDLQAYYDDLTDYMSDLAKWIVSHLNFDIKQPDVNVNVPGYDDSSVIGWLRRIYYKLRGTGTPRPDPIEDTDGAFDWWSKFLEWITNALGGLLTDFVGDLGGFLQELIDTFPFSIPWDIVAMLTLLDAQRATPDVTFTIPAQNGWWNDITIRINLDAYDDAMATVRGMMLIWWMYILVMKTDWMMLLFDGANNAIGDFVSRLTGKG